MNHCVICGNNILKDKNTCEESGFGDGCGRTLGNIEDKELENTLDSHIAVIASEAFKIREPEYDIADFVPVVKEVMTNFTDKRVRQERHSLWLKIADCGTYDGYADLDEIWKIIKND